MNEYTKYGNTMDTCSIIKGIICSDALFHSCAQIVVLWISIAQQERSLANTNVAASQLLAY